MARKTYANSNKPIMMAWIGPGVALLGWILYAFASAYDKPVWMIVCLSLIYGLGFYLIWKSYYCVIDDEERIIFSQENRKYPMKVDEIAYVMYKESKKGRFRSLFIHDTGLGFFSLKVSKKKADAIVADLLAMNPSIEIKHANYL